MKKYAMAKDLLGEKYIYFQINYFKLNVFI